MNLQNTAHATHSVSEERSASHGSYFASDITPLIDARKILDGGIGIYTQNLIEGLIEKDIRVGLLGDPEVLSRFPWYERVDVEYEKAMPYSFDELLSLAGRHDFSRYSLFHTPHYVLPFHIPIPSVITIHDLIHIHNPEKWYYPFVANRLMSSSMKRADAIITVSKATRDELQEFAGRNRALVEKISIIPNALHRKYHPGGDAGQEVPILGEGKPVKKCASISVQGTAIKGDYLLSVISMHKPHKGLCELLEAFRMYTEKTQAKQGRAELKLVLAGSGLSQIIKDEQLFEQITNMKNVQIVGKVSAEELTRLYKNARALVVASRAEGFCLPVIEAQSFGVPVVSCPVPAVQEILCKNDFLIGGFTPQDIAKCLEDVADILLESKPSGIPYEHLKRFDRSTITEQILGVYGSVIESERRAAA